MGNVVTPSAALRRVNPPTILKMQKPNKSGVENPLHYDPFMSRLSTLVFLWNCRFKLMCLFSTPVVRPALFIYFPFLRFSGYNDCLLYFRRRRASLK
jgi:hypothetical protein